MDDALRSYLDAHVAHHETTESWPIHGRLKVRLALGSTLPPPHVSSSILAIVVNANRHVLFLHPSSPSGTIAHVLIGGRPEAGETPEQTVIREALEETGWRIEPIRLIGFRHFQHLDPNTPRNDRPYPDFIQPIYAARAIAHEPALALPADRIPAEFIDFEVAENLTEPGQRPLLRATIEAF
jgi:ADP-ribose pyrophosphatase YjhB (NUDIX family)